MYKYYDLLTNLLTYISDCQHCLRWQKLMMRVSAWIARLQRQSATVKCSVPGAFHLCHR